MFGITPAFCLCEEALIRQRIPWAACQQIIHALSVNHIWQTGSLYAVHVCFVGAHACTKRPVNMIVLVCSCSCSCTRLHSVFMYFYLCNSILSFVVSASQRSERGWDDAATCQSRGAVGERRRLTMVKSSHDIFNQRMKCRGTEAKLISGKGHM